MISILKRPSFIVGLLIGVFLAILLKFNKEPQQPPSSTKPLQTYHYYKSWFNELKLTRKAISFDELRYSNRTFVTESKYLYNKVTVLCIVLVKTLKNVQAVKDTWGKHCNRVEFVELHIEKRKIPSIKRQNEESSWVLLCAALRQVSENFKWVLIVYDDMFVLVDNLRFYVAALNYNETYYLGHATKLWNKIYNKGQAGYVISKGVLDLFKKKFDSLETCTRLKTYRNQEDYYLGQVLAVLNVTPSDTRDFKGLSTFHPYNLYLAFFPGQNYYKNSVFPHRCCSSRSITFQVMYTELVLLALFFIVAFFRFFFLSCTATSFQSGLTAFSFIFLSFLISMFSPLFVSVN